MLILQNPDNVRALLVRSGYTAIDARSVVDNAANDLGSHYVTQGQRLWVTCEAIQHSGDGSITYAYAITDGPPPKASHDGYECELCGTTFFTLYALDQHEHDAPLAWDETWGLVEE